MPLSRRLRFYGVPFVGSVALFFQFIGHLSHNFKNVLLGRVSISWFNLFYVVYRSGAKLVIPLMLISSLMGVSLILNIYHILSPLYLQDRILLVAQNILFYDLVPFIIGLVLSVQLALNLVNIRIKGLQRTTDVVILKEIIPILLGANFSALLLYLYSLNAIFISIYFCFRYLLSMDLHEYLFHLTNTITSINMMFSIFKTLLYCTMVSLVVGYYYYVVAAAYLSLRMAMSRIMTRSLLCLAVSSVYFKFFSY